MVGRRRDLSAEEIALWARVAATTRPIGRAVPLRQGEDDNSESETAAAPTAQPQRRDGVPNLGAKRPTPAFSQLPLTGLDRRTEQRLRRGAIEVDGRIDLHGMTQAAAHAALRRFLMAAQQGGLRLVLVITGKGVSLLDDHGEHLVSAPRGVLSRQVPLWLEDIDLRPLVSGFRHAHPRHGGSGALYVRVRRPR